MRLPVWRKTGRTLQWRDELTLPIRQRGQQFFEERLESEGCPAASAAEKAPSPRVSRAAATACVSAARSWSALQPSMALRPPTAKRATSAATPAAQAGNRLGRQALGLQHQP